jgi:predicted MFS family arabinose efflux permease
VLTGLISGTDSFVIGSLLPSISAELDVTVGDAGYVAFTYATVYAIGTPVLATLFGHIDRRRVLVAAYLTFAVGGTLMALAPNLLLLVAARVVVALGAGLFTATALATAVAMSSPERRGRTIALVTSGQSLAVLAGVPLGAFVVSVYSWRLIFAVLAVLAFIAVIGLAWNLPRDIHGDKVTMRERLSVVKLPGIPRALLATVFFMLAHFTLLVFVAPLVKYAGGIGKDVLPFVLVAYGLGAVAGTQFGGRVADRIGARRATFLAASAQAALLTALLAAGLLPPAVGTIAVFVIMPALAVMGWGFYPAQSSQIASLVAGSPALALSLNLSAMNIGVAVAARLGGAVLDQAGAFWLAATTIPAAIAAMLVIQFAAPRRRVTSTAA